MSGFFYWNEFSSTFVLIFIYLQVVFYNRNENVGYHYKYCEATSNSKYQPKYHWEHLDWGECSARCGGGGTQISLGSCVEERVGKLSASFCHGIDRRPPKTRICNEFPCPVKWVQYIFLNCIERKKRATIFYFYILAISTLSRAEIWV